MGVPEQHLLQVQITETTFVIFRLYADSDYWCLMSRKIWIGMTDNVNDNVASVTVIKLHRLQ